MASIARTTPAIAAASSSMVAGARRTFVSAPLASTRRTLSVSATNQRTLNPELSPIVLQQLVESLSTAESTSVESKHNVGSNTSAGSIMAHLASFSSEQAMEVDAASRPTTSAKLSEAIFVQQSSQDYLQK